MDPAKLRSTLRELGRAIATYARECPELFSDAVHSGWSLLGIAASAGICPLATLLLREAGADPDRACPAADAATPLLLACMAGQCEMASILLAAGADVNAARVDGVSPLYVAARLGSEPLVRLLLAAGADVRRQRPDGATALYAACKRGNAPVARALLRAGADTESSRNGWTPLMIAARNGHAGVAALLLAEGADARASTPGGLSALSAAIHGGSAEVVDALVAAGLRVDECRVPNTSPLILACHTGDARVVEALLRGGADPNGRVGSEGPSDDPRATTPLMYASTFGKSDVGISCVEDMRALPRPANPQQAKVMYDFEATRADELSLHEGDEVTIEAEEALDCKDGNTFEVVHRVL
eukprot:m51a1_g5075 putative ankyrin repeat protein (357) ;mRNA; r:195852-204376